MMNEENRKFFKIIEETGLTVHELTMMVKEKIEELNGLISEEGAIFIIASELGVNIKTKIIDSDTIFLIENIQSGMKNVNMTGRVMSIYELREFTKKDGGNGYVFNFIIEDSSGRIKIVLWDDFAYEMSKNLELEEGILVRIEKAYVKWSDYSQKYELNVPKWGKVILNPLLQDDDDDEKYPKKIEKDWGEF